MRSDDVLFRDFFRLFFPVFLIFVSLSSCCRVCIAEDTMRIYLEPERTTVAVCAAFKVNVSIADVPLPGLYSYEFTLQYNSSVIECAKVTVPVDYFLTPSVPGQVFIHGPIINQTEGSIWAGASLLVDEEGKVGGGVLLTITLKAKTLGNSTLTIPHTVLTRPDGLWRSADYVVLDGLVEVVLPDFNNDGKVDTSDLTIIRDAFGSTPGQRRWNPACDVNKDSKINILDIAVTAKAYGKTITKQSIRASTTAYKTRHGHRCAC
jgi:hypothetical protein